MKQDKRSSGSSDPLPPSSSVWPHRFALLTACATFPLLFIGGLVTSKGAGLAVPDWPTTFGYNMFLYPWSKMVGGIFYEHSHRLVGSFVGMCTIGLALSFWLQERRSWLRWLGILALMMVIAQGVLGGLRVVLLEHALAIFHAAFAQAFFGFTVCLALFTSRGWHQARGEAPLGDGGRLLRLGITTVALIYIQIVFGAVLRHTGARLDAHLFFAALVLIHVVLLALRVARQHSERRTLVRPAVYLSILMAAQLFLGFGSYFGKYTTMLRWPAEAVVYLTTVHLIVAALMLAASLVLTLRAYRLSVSGNSMPARAVLREQPSL